MSTGNSRIHLRLENANSVYRAVVAGVLRSCCVEWDGNLELFSNAGPWKFESFHLVLVVGQGTGISANLVRVCLSFRRKQAKSVTVIGKRSSTISGDVRLPFALKRSRYTANSRLNGQP